MKEEEKVEGVEVRSSMRSVGATQERGGKAGDHQAAVTI